MLLAATTVAALLIASPSLTDADRIAADGGFLLGNAHRCGIAPDQVVAAGRRIRGLIAAATDDSGDEARATKRFAEFFLVSALADPTKGPVATCTVVASELARFERHPFKNAGAGG
ncbi:MAG TPA: hypothetical protein VME41_10475 [Stellaceae bacterium]|nr:hypothetical protein [Stellaceae bacterium]